jgi:N-acyl-D-amino-acid deacylase
MKALIVVFLYGPLAWGADSPSPERIRSAAEKALALLQASQEIWDAKQLGGQGCASCHHQLMPQLAYRVACEHGLRVNERVARENARRALSSRAELDRAVQYTHVIGPSVADALRLVAEDAAGGRRNIARAVYARLIAARQNPSGAWDRDSFHQRPPSSYSPFTQTALAVRALQLYSHPSLQADTEARLARARQ